MERLEITTPANADEIVTRTSARGRGAELFAMYVLDWPVRVGLFGALLGFGVGLALLVYLWRVERVRLDTADILLVPLIAAVILGAVFGLWAHSYAMREWNRQHQGFTSRTETVRLRPPEGVERRANYRINAGGQQVIEWCGMAYTRRIWSKLAKTLIENNPERRVTRQLTNTSGVTTNDTYGSWIDKAIAHDLVVDQGGGKNYRYTDKLYAWLLEHWQPPAPYNG